MCDHNLRYKDILCVRQDRSERTASRVLRARIDCTEVGLPCARLRRVTAGRHGVNHLLPGPLGR